MYLESTSIDICSISDYFIIESIFVLFQMHVDIFYNNLVTIMSSMTNQFFVECPVIY